MNFFRQALNDLLIAFGLLTRLPLPQPVWPEETSPARAAWAYPLAGVLVAGLAGATSSALLAVGLPATFVAGIALGITVITTGAMHEDGLADCADGFWGGWDKARRLKIMKDSNTGAYGAIALVLVIGLRWSALSALFAAGWVWVPLLVAAIASRTAMVWVMASLPLARTEGLASSTGKPSFAMAGLASLWTLLTCIALSGFGLGVVIVIVGIGAVFVALWAVVAQRKIGGQTGDVLGASQQVGEVALLGSMTALL